MEDFSVLDERQLHSLSNVQASLECPLHPTHCFESFIFYLEGSLKEKTQLAGKKACQVLGTGHLLLKG